MSVEHGLTVLLGNPKPRSRTRSVVLRATDMLRSRLDGVGVATSVPRLVDLAELPPQQLLVPPGDRCTAVREAFAQVSLANLLVVASPTFKGTFTGLLKVFVDLLPQDGLRGTVAVALMTAASPAHQHAVESYLRPLLLALGATVPAPGLTVLEAQFTALDPVLAAWTASAVPVLAGVLSQRERDLLLSHL